MGRSGWLVGGLLWLAALGVRLLYIEQSQTSPFFDYPLVDAKTYTDAAERMGVQGHWDGGDAPFWQPPLYPYFLGFLYALFTPGYYLPRLVQAAISAFNCVLLYLLGRRLFSPSLGLAAAVAAALYGPLVFFAGEFLPPPLALFFNLLILLTLPWAMAGRPRRLLVPGFCLGLAALAVANILLFLPAALLWVIVVRRALPWPRRLLDALPLLLGASLVIAPVTLRNYLIGDDLVLISSNGGINFYLGNNANYEETIRIPPGPAWRTLVSQPRTEAGLTRASDQSDYFFAQAWDFISTEPSAWFLLLLHKTYLFWHGDEIGRNQDLYYARNFSPLLSLLLWKATIAFPFGVVAPLALLGMGLVCYNRGQRRAEIDLLLLYIVVYALSVIVFFPTARYRLPIVPPLLLFAAYAVSALYYLGRERAGVKLAWAGGALAALLVACNFRVGPMNMAGDAETLHRLGFVYQQKGLPANAIAAYEQALTLDPEIREARFNLGALYARRGRYDRAIAAYQNFVVRYPDYPEARYALGNALLHAGRYAEAIAQYEKLLDADAAPERKAVQERLAYAHIQLDQLDAAAALYRDLVVQAPDSLRFRYQLGQLTEALGQPGLARREYAEVLRRDSTHIDAGLRLAHLLLATDESTAAEVQLKRLIAAHPHLVAPRWLLATHYATQHEGTKALAQAQAILEIQPDHVQANRMVGHLQVIQGDTLAGIKNLDRFKKYYVEERQQAILEALKDQWRQQLKGMF